jgi:hypothetical protein
MPNDDYPENQPSPTLCKISTMPHHGGMSRISAVAVLLVSAALLSGCASPEPFVGTVMTLSPNLCVGRHAATGDCFTDVDASSLSRLHLGDCVKVEFTPSSNSGPKHVKTIALVPATSYPDDCPPDARLPG